jgi:hypothetical protein
MARLIEDMDAVPDSNQAMAYPIMLSFLHETLVDWDGVVIADSGEPRKFSSEAIDELDYEDVVTFVGSLRTIGDAGSGNPKAETASAADSQEPVAP